MYCKPQEQLKLMFSIIRKGLPFLENSQGYLVAGQNKLCSTVYLLLQLWDFKDNNALLKKKKKTLRQIYIVGLT